MEYNWGILGPGFIATRAVIPAIQQVPGAHVLAVASSNRDFHFFFNVPSFEKGELM